MVGKYRLLSVVGEGAMGTVFRAVHATLGREVAVKVLRGDVAGASGEMHERVMREIRVCMRLDHPHILRVLDWGLVDGRPFYVMEYLEHARKRQLEESVQIELATGADPQAADVPEGGARVELLADGGLP